MLKIIKRDGRKVDFSDDKMKSAIWRAMERTEKGIDSQLTTKIVDLFKSKHSGEVEVDQIQDFIEKELMKSSRKDAASEFIKKRHERDVARNAKTKNIFMGIIQAENNEITRENANMNADTPAGMMMKFASETTKPFVDNYLISDEAKDAVRNNYIHIHDKDYYPTKSLTCVSEDSHVVLMTSDGETHYTTLKYLSKFFKEDPTIDPNSVSPNEFIWIQGRNGWTKITKISRRLLKKDEDFYYIKTNKGLGIKLTGDHLVPSLDSEGKELLVNARDLTVGNSLLGTPTFNSNDIKEDYIDVVKAINSDEDKVVICNLKKLSLYLKYKYDVTSLSKYIESDTYRLGVDYITLSDYKKLLNNFNLPYEITSTLRVKMFNSKDSLPLYLNISEDLVKVLGYLHSDGSLSYDNSSYQGAFINHNPNILNNFKESFEKVFPNKLTARLTDGKQTGWVFSGKTLVWLLKYVLGHKENAYDISIPEFIKKADDNIKWNYISALIDGDGCVSEKSNRQVNYFTSSKEFSEEISLLLKSLGVESSISIASKESSEADFNGKTSIRKANNYKINVSGYDNIEKVLTNLTCIKNNSINAFYAAKPTTALKHEPNEIKNIIPLSTDGVVVYDLETVEHWYSVNEIIVHNCLQHPLDKILEKGFKAGHGEARPAKRIETASILACISMESIQNEMHGGQAIPALDFYMAPYVRMTYIEELEDAFNLLGLELTDEIKNEKFKDYVYKDIKEIKDPLQKAKQKAMNSTIRRVHQSMESFIHNLNTIHSRGGNQVVFSSVNYGTDTSAEGRCVMRELLLTTERGVGNGSTAIFPIQIWKLKKGVSYLPGDPNYDLYKLACRVTAKRFFPNFLNLDASFNQDPLWKEDDPKRYLHEVATMGKRKLQPI